MSNAFVSHGASIVRGWCWHVYPDPAVSGVMGRDEPFPIDDIPGDEGGSVARKPDGVLRFWKVLKNTPGLLNAHEGQSYLVLTERHEPPPVTSGWTPEAARLTDTFQIDQRGDRWVRLVRHVAKLDTRFGPLQECEFQIDR